MNNSKETSPATPKENEFELGQMYMSDNHIIIASEVRKQHILGFDLFTENLVKIEKTNLVKAPKVLTKLVSDKKVQYFIARHNSEFIHELTTILKVSDRTAHRMQRDYDLM